ncbi:MAG: zf-HC2 domain-containing protein, partial [Pseudomonadota bacterium]
MTFDAQKLSAYLDGELSPEETHAVETALSQDAALQAELESLMAADDLARTEFGQMLEEPVPLSMAAAIRS